MPVVDPSVLVGLQKNIRHVRNICILAHVDHGKTTLADSLLASNGIISQRMAGKLRYMDSRQDEQERGITMKSSSISLYYQREADGGGEPEDFLVNLIDSPGHVDFSSEVSTAVRLCDGAIIVVDVVEGVGPQTRACLHQVYTEQLKPVLLMNKIDRLILEKQMSPLDAYFHISQVLEQVNAVLGNIFASDVLAKEDISEKENYESPLEQVDDSLLYFTPASGNVIFCSAYDGWAFTVRNFSKIYAERLEMSPAELEEKLWGDYYYSPKQKAVLPGAQEKAKRPMFVQFVLDNIWQLYETIAVRKDKEKLPAIAAKLGLKLLARDLRSTDAKSQIKTVLGQWLPIDQTVLEMVTRHVPAPNSISDERAARLLFPANADPTGVPPETLALTGSFQECSASCEDVVVFVSKMVPVHVSQLPQNRPKRLGDAELQARRDDVRKRIEERKLAAAAADSMEGIVKAADECTISNPQETTKAEEPPKASGGEASEEEKPEFAFVAFARVFSGTLRRGMKLYSLSPKHDPRNKALLNTDSPHVTEVTVGDLYLFMGGELQPLDEVPAGNIVGIGGLENSIVKTATLSTTLYSTGFSELNMMATPILRVAIEPSNPLDMPKFMKGLKLLNQSDACVQVSVESSGEHVITTLGEVHMEKCVRDLEENFAKIKVNVSKPIVPFRETIVAASTVDMVNEAIVRTAEDKDIKKKIVTAHSLNKLSCLQLIALPLPQRVVDILERHSLFLKELTASQSGGVKIAATLATIRSQLIDAMDEFDTNGFTALRGPELVDRIWSLGPRQCATNMLLNLSDYQHPPFWTSSEASAEMCMQHDARRDYNSSVVNGFQLATSAGPLCEEPMQGVCFVVLQWTVSPNEDELNSKAYGPFSGQVLNTSKDACRMAFQNQPQRLVSPMYSCSIVVNADMLGKMYAVIGRRHGKILSGDLTQGSGNFSVTAVLPVIESFNFAQEIRKQTSGLACPQLMFSHWEIIDIDPFWVPTTEEEITHYGEKADSANRAKLYMDSVRRRKGLYVDEKVVEHAEKQRTLSKNK